MLLLRDVEHPLSLDEQNIEDEIAKIESEVLYATVYESISFSESIYEYGTAESSKC